MIDNNIKIIVAGDFVPPHYDVKLYSDELMGVLKDKDFSIVNLETPLTLGAEPIEKIGYNYKRPPSAIMHLRNGCFDAVTLSNNHIRDFGDVGVIDTIETCRLNNILTVGAERSAEEAAKPLRLNLKGKKISVLNYSEREFNVATEKRAGANPFDLIDAFHQISSEKQLHDFVIVIYHGGLEYHHVPLPGIKRNLEFLLDNGADVVICHHTHYISGYSIYKGKPIFYGLGNLYFKYKSAGLIKDDCLNMGMLVRLSIDQNNNLKYELIWVKKSIDQSVLNYISSSKEIENLDSQIKQFNEIINSDEKLQKYWKGHRGMYKLKYYSSIKYANPIFGKLITRLTNKKNINIKYMIRVSNIINCDSHREMILKAFNNW